MTQSEFEKHSRKLGLKSEMRTALCFFSGRDEFDWDVFFEFSERGTRFGKTPNGKDRVIMTWEVSGKYYTYTMYATQFAALTKAKVDHMVDLIRTGNENYEYFQTELRAVTGDLKSRLIDTL